MIAGDDAASVPSRRFQRTLPVSLAIETSTPLSASW
jgi:hypothetical protein